MAREMMSKPGSTVGLPNSEKMAGGERVGIENTGYLTSKGLEAPNGKSPMPPGMNIENQMNADIHAMEVKTYKGGMGYPGDGWD